ncbi:DUF397 domain-containing protein [Spirillospora sp. NPDC049024]
MEFGRSCHTMSDKTTLIESEQPMQAAHALFWRRSSFCVGDGNCVEAARTPDGSIAVRDTKRGENGPVLTFSAAAFDALLTRVRTELPSRPA